MDNSNLWNGKIDFHAEPDLDEYPTSEKRKIYILAKNYANPLEVSLMSEIVQENLN